METTVRGNLPERSNTRKWYGNVGRPRIRRLQPAAVRDPNAAIGCPLRPEADRRLTAIWQLRLLINRLEAGLPVDPRSVKSTADFLMGLAA